MESFALEKLAVKLNGTPLGAKDSLFTKVKSKKTDESHWNNSIKQKFKKGNKAIHYDGDYFSVW